MNNEKVIDLGEEKYSRLTPEERRRDVRSQFIEDFHDLLNWVLLERREEIPAEEVLQNLLPVVLSMGTVLLDLVEVD